MPRGVPAVVRRGALSVHWNAPPPLPPTVELTGLLHEDHHGSIPEPVPRTRGTVRRVRLLSWRFELRDRTLQRVPATEVLTDLERAPRWFTAPIDEGGPMRHAVGVLVDLAVDLGRA